MTVLPCLVCSTQCLVIRLTVIANALRHQLVASQNSPLPQADQVVAGSANCSAVAFDKGVSNSCATTHTRAASLGVPLHSSFHGSLRRSGLSDQERLQNAAADDRRHRSAAGHTAAADSSPARSQKVLGWLPCERTCATRATASFPLHVQRFRVSARSKEARSQTQN